MSGLKTPDITPGAIVALVSGLFSNLGIIFWPGMAPDVKGAAVGVITTVVLAAFLIHDAIIRKGRSSVVAAKMSFNSSPDAGEAFVAPG